MIRIKNAYVSPEQPAVGCGLWLKPVSGGFAAYLIEGATITPLKLVDDNSTATPVDDAVQDLVGSVQDKKTDNTINGAKAYAKDQADTLMGTEDDTAADMTLYGLKAYIDSKVPAQGEE